MACVIEQTAKKCFNLYLTKNRCVFPPKNDNEKNCAQNKFKNNLLKIYFEFLHISNALK